MRNRRVTERAVTSAEEARLTIHALRYQLTLLRRALDRVAVGVVVTCNDGSIAAANKAARALLQQHCDLQPDRPAPAAHRNPPTVAKLLTTIRDSDSPVTRTIEVGNEPIHILAAPLAHSEHTDGGAKVIFLCNPSRPLDASEQLLRSLYHFTAAEAKLVLELINGRSIEEASERLNITENTARSHLKKVFSKTQTKRQGEVVRLVTSTLAALDLSQS